MATLAALNVAAQTAKLNEAAIAAATAEAKLDKAEREELEAELEETQEEVGAWRADAAHRHEVRSDAAQRAAETRRENKYFAPMKAEYDALTFEALRLQGAMAALSQVCDMAAFMGSFPHKSTLRLREKKAETEKKYNDVIAKGRELYQKLPARMRASTTYKHDLS